MKSKKLNKKSLKQQGGEQENQQPELNPALEDLIPSIKAALEQGTSVKELISELAQQQIPITDIQSALSQIGMSEDQIHTIIGWVLVSGLGIVIFVLNAVPIIGEIFSANNIPARWKPDDYGFSLTERFLLKFVREHNPLSKSVNYHLLSDPIPTFR